MKKLTALLLALVMVLSLAACGAKETTPETKAPEAAAPVETKAPVEEAPAAPTSLNIYGIYKSESPYFVNEAASIEKALNDKGAEYGIEVTWHFLNCDGDAEKYMTQIDTAIADNADAIVTCIPDQTMSEAVVAKCEAAGVLIVACDDPLKDGDNNKLAPWFGIDAYNIGYAAGEWMADYATENNMTEDETVGVLYMTMNTTSSCVPRTEGEKQAMADKLSGAFDNRTYEVDYVTTMEDAYNGASAMIAGHPEIKSWLVMVASEQGALGVASAIENAGLADTSCVVTLGCDETTGHWEEGNYAVIRSAAYFSGKVVGIEPVELANGSTVSAVVIENDFQNNWVELHPAEHPETLTAQELQTIVREAGIVGMGGATFPTQVKITPPKGKTIEKLVINGAECEPYLTADHRLMLEKPAEIIDGIHLMMLALDVKEAHVGVENNKMDAVEALRAAAKNVEGITIHDLPVRYPQGGEKQLVYALTRRKVPTGGLPLDVGCVVSNVGTVYAIQQAIREGRPLVQRVTTVGGLVNNPGNFLVSVGTPIDTLLEACGGMQSGARMLISGGPMMGMAITRTDIPVTKGTSGVLVLGEEAVDPVESACINCGRCLRACPMQLMPTLLDRCVRADRYDEAEKYGIMNCIECGACTFVCPAKRLLTQSCRQGKKVITTRKKAEAAKKAAAEAAKKAAEEQSKKEA